MKTVIVKVRNKDFKVKQFETLKEAQADFSEEELVSKINFAYRIQKRNAFLFLIKRFLK